jgi:hypothetical protein
VIVYYAFSMMCNADAIAHDRGSFYGHKLNVISVDIARVLLEQYFDLLLSSLHFPISIDSLYFLLLFTFRRFLHLRFSTSMQCSEEQRVLYPFIHS